MVAMSSKQSDLKQKAEVELMVMNEKSRNPKMVQQLFQVCRSRAFSAKHSCRRVGRAGVGAELKMSLA